MVAIPSALWESIPAATYTAQPNTGGVFQYGTRLLRFVHSASRTRSGKPYCTAFTQRVPDGLPAARRLTVDSLGQTLRVREPRVGRKSIRRGASKSCRRPQATSVSGRLLPPSGLKPRFLLVRLSARSDSCPSRSRTPARLAKAWKDKIPTSRKRRETPRLRSGRLWAPLSN